MMNWITTNIRLPEDDYQKLKMTAAKQRTSLGALIRKKLGVKEKMTNDREEVLCRLEKFAQKMAKKYPHSNLSQKLIEMRYEQ